MITSNCLQDSTRRSTSSPGSLLTKKLGALVNAGEDGVGEGIWGAAPSQWEGDDGVTTSAWVGFSSTCLHNMQDEEPDDEVEEIQCKALMQCNHCAWTTTDPEVPVGQMRPSSSNIYEQVNSASYKHTPQPSKTYQTNIAMMETSGASVTISCGEVYQSVLQGKKAIISLQARRPCRQVLSSDSIPGAKHTAPGCMCGWPCQTKCHSYMEVLFEAMYKIQASKELCYQGSSLVRACDWIHACFDPHCHSHQWLPPPLPPNNHPH